jgi:ATP-dependent RNA helicase DDX56/DBP9
MEEPQEKRGKKRKASKPDKETNEKASVDDTASFSSFRLDPRLLKAVSNQFEKPTLVQAAAIPLAINGRDIVARAKTGSGKTAAYVIPILHQILTKSVPSFWFCANI